MKKSEEWININIPKQHSRSVIITGTGGLGYETALVLVRAGAEVIFAGRNEKKGAESVNKIRTIVPSANIRFESIDLADLASIEAFGARIKNQRQSLDLLINNAGVMTPPKRKVTKDGFELQFGTNYLGHFALTAHLMPLLRKGNKPRVVTVSSMANRERKAKINFDDLQSERNYHSMDAYDQSKLADLMFTLELQRRSDAAGWGIMSIASHPGISSTDLMANGPGEKSLLARMLNIFTFMRQSAQNGALPSLYAAAAPNAEGGGYYGPGGFYEIKGLPGQAKIPTKAQDVNVAKRLWEVSKQLTSVDFDKIASMCEK
ncbi:SDR family oxidoreductase [Clostridium chromiireducens]|uniref:2,3-dihydro-2,3-dihydroxybenzoate dehydrogenase n=1 Tax=Clostridium chromiireducens TaxID=225345 RepID=A0A1V4INJ9_9CLOT|nr:SDR family oxidoreductase [Clostridium chromiireducens]OPJ61628.1 2,3-dihydro-2,3-dihydroxybenzoate dehydrogenase [Clostridium chromiireducens]